MANANAEAVNNARSARILMALLLLRNNVPTGCSGLGSRITDLFQAELAIQGDPEPTRRNLPSSFQNLHRTDERPRSAKRSGQRDQNDGLQPIMRRRTEQRIADCGDDKDAIPLAPDKFCRCTLQLGGDPDVPAVRKERNMWSVPRCNPMLIVQPNS